MTDTLLKLPLLLLLFLGIALFGSALAGYVLWLLPAAVVLLPFLVWPCLVMVRRAGQRHVHSGDRMMESPAQTGREAPLPTAWGRTTLLYWYAAAAVLVLLAMFT